MRHRARINILHMLKYETVHRVTEQTFLNTPTSLVPKFTLGSGLGFLLNINHRMSGRVERKSGEIVAAKSFIVRKHDFFWI